MVLLPFGMTLYICMWGLLTGEGCKVPRWTKQITVAVFVLGILAAGTVGPDSWPLILGHTLAMGLALAIGLKLFAKSHRYLWLILMFAPFVSGFPAQVWVAGQSLVLRNSMAPTIVADVAAWNQNASLDTELPGEVRSQDIRVYRSWSPTKRVGLLNNKQRIEFVVDIKDNTIVDVVRVAYLTSGRKWIWPSIAS